MKRLVEELAFVMSTILGSCSQTSIPKRERDSTQWEFIALKKHLKCLASSKKYLSC